jgi:Mn2+/Fe2+ NRAMP family transporter
MEAAAVRDPPRTFVETVKSIGPGLIITANIVGTGELIATTQLGSKAGFTLLWFIIFGCFIKVFVQVEWGRFTISERASSLDALNAFPGPRPVVSWVVWLWILMYIGTFFQLTTMVSTIAKMMPGAASPPVERLWAMATAVSVAVLLFVGRYGLVEKGSTLMVVAFTICTVIAAVAIQWTEWGWSGGEIAAGLAFRVTDDFLIAFGAFAITGVGAAEIIFYPIWLLEKGYARHVGPRDGSPEWTARARGWLRVLRTDAWLSMAIYTIATVGFYILGASILHRQGLVVADKELVPTLSRMYEGAFGAWGGRIFLVGAFMVLYSTLFVSTASDGRLFADLGLIMGFLKPGDDVARRRAIRGSIAAILCFVLGVYLLWGGFPVSLMMVGAVAQGIMLPFLGFGALWFRHKRTDPALRPGPAWTAFLWLSFASLAAVGVYLAGKSAKLWS